MSTSRTRVDKLLTVAQALPAANANNSSAGIDLAQVTAFPINESIDFKVSVPATEDLEDTKTITLKIQDSADNSTFADIASLATLVVTATASGGAATSRTVKLPGSTKRYVRVNAAVAADGGDNTAVSYTSQILC